MADEKGGSDESEELLDRISMLPDDINLGYLPITDAVRTSVLSKKWRSHVGMNQKFFISPVWHKNDKGGRY